MLALVIQACSLLWGVVWHATCALLYLPIAIVACLLAPIRAHAADPRRACFFTGTVSHQRRQPAANSFAHPVRLALVDLDSPPPWWGAQAADHMSAKQARAFAGTQGGVKLLTNPVAAGYVQNPISVYYCYEPAGCLAACIAEVTNTPWGQRVTFAFSPSSQAAVPKSLHVSPLMDMANTWHISASDPLQAAQGQGQGALRLVVAASHPQHGDYFTAVLNARRCSRWPHLPNEQAGLTCLLAHGFQPHRIALWIYWQALVLLYKGVPFYGPPDPKVYQPQVEAAAAASSGVQRSGISGCCFTWRPALTAPWNWK